MAQVSANPCAEALAPRQVFLDIDNIPIGIDYEEHLKQQVSTCHALLVVIGPHWLEVRDDTGKRRLDNAEDFVHIEIQTALDRNIPVVPVLLDTTMPKAEQLPEALKPIVKRQYWEITRKRFQTDVDGLARRLNDVLNGAQPATPLAPTVARSAIKVDVGTASCDLAMPGQCETRFLLPGAGKTEWFKDLDVGPEMVVVPAGSFMMGSPENEPERDEPKDSAGKEEQHRVTFSEPFAVGRCTVTRGEFAAFVQATDHQTSDEAFVVKNDNYEFSKGYSWRNPGFAQDDNHPVVWINWHDAKAYAAWLAAATGKLYRLLSEAEWEYVCRAGTTTTFWWGSAISSSEANYNASYIYAGGGKKGEWRKRTLPVESFSANPWGLYQLSGNVWEQCEDWWNESTVGAPADGSAWIAGDSSRRVLRGGSWFNYPWSLRSAHRHGCYITGRVSGFGFRVARTLTT